MALGVNVTLRNGWLDDMSTAIDAGAGAGLLEFYDGAQPATGGATTNLLGTVVCSDPCAPAANAGVLTFSTFTDDDSADATGVSTWARFTDSDGTFVCDCTVGTSGTDIILNSASIVIGGIIRVTSGTLTAGNA